MVDEPLLHRLFTVQHGADVHHQLPGVHHQPPEVLGGDLGIVGDKPNDALLHPVKVGQRLRHAQHQAVHPHRVDGHGGRRRDERLPRAAGQRHADRVSAAQHQRDGRLFHPGNQLRDGQPRLHVSADGVQDNHQPLDGGVLLDGDQLGDDVLILGGLVLRGQDVVPLDLPDDGQAVDDVLCFGHGDRSGLHNLLGLVRHLFIFRRIAVLRGLVDGVLFQAFLLLFLFLSAHTPHLRRKISSGIVCARGVGLYPLQTALFIINGFGG